MATLRYFTYQITRCWDDQQGRDRYFGRIEYGHDLWQTWTEGPTHDDAFQSLWRWMLKQHNFERTGYYIEIETKAEKRQRLIRESKSSPRGKALSLSR